MLINKMFKKIILIFILNIFINSNTYASNDDFNSWLINFKVKAINSGISEKVVNDVMSGVKFLPRVIEYDRYQPEFYEDNFTYIIKRSSKKKINQGLKLYKKDKIIIDKVENEFKVEKELLLALMGMKQIWKIFRKNGYHFIISNLSYDKVIFTKELLILLKLVDNKIIDKTILFGSWAALEIFNLCLELLEVCNRL